MNELRILSPKPIPNDHLPGNCSRGHTFALSSSVRPPPLLMPYLIARVRQVQVPIRSLGRQYHHAYNTTRAAIPPDGLLQRVLDEVYCLLLLHALLPVCVAVTVDVGGTGAANRVGLFVQRAAQRDAVDLATVALVPACDDETGTTKKQCQLMGLVMRQSRGQGGDHPIAIAHVPSVVEDRLSGPLTSACPCLHSTTPETSRPPSVSWVPCHSSCGTCPAGTVRCPQRLVYRRRSRIGSTRWYRGRGSACLSLGWRCMRRSSSWNQRLDRRRDVSFSDEGLGCVGTEGRGGGGLKGSHLVSHRL